MPLNSCIGCGQKYDGAPHGFCEDCRIVEDVSKKSLFELGRYLSLKAPDGNNLLFIPKFNIEKQKKVMIEKEILKIKMKDVILIHLHKNKSFYPSVMAVSGLEGEVGMIYCQECGVYYGISSDIFSRRAPVGAIMEYLIKEWKTLNIE